MGRMPSTKEEKFQKLSKNTPFFFVVALPPKILPHLGHFSFCKNRQVGKSDVFTKESLRKLQDKMRMLCIESFNKEYNLTNSLKGKKKRKKS